MDECHVPGTCNPSTGSCTNPTRPDGTACTGGTCQAGACLPTCASSSDCAAGTFCVNGVCCESACLCGVCSTTGHCAPAGNDAKVGVVCAEPTCADLTHSALVAVCVATSGDCPGATTVDCVAYRCDETTKLCKQECSRPDDCAPGFACDEESRCVVPPPVSASGACVLAVGGPRRTGPLWLEAALLAALAVSRAARRPPPGRVEG
jgi:hypothetical protein